MKECDVMIMFSGEGQRDFYIFFNFYDRKVSIIFLYIIILCILLDYYHDSIKMHLIIYTF